MKHSLNTVRVGLFFLLGAALTWIVYETLHEGRIFGQQGYRLYAQFDNIGTLSKGDDVRMAGVRIGTVIETRLYNSRAETVIEIAPNVRVARDAVAAVAMAGVLGGNFLSIYPGTGDDYLSAGDIIATRHSPGINEIIAQLSNAASHIEGVTESINGVFALVTGTPDDPGVARNLNTLIEENREAIRETMADIRSITGKIDRGEGTLARLINDDAAYQSIVATVEEIREAAQSANAFTSGGQDLIAQVQRGEGTLGHLIHDEEIARELQMLTENLRVISDKLARGEGTLGRLLADDELYRDIQATIRRTERTLEGMGEHGPISAVGIAAQALF